MALGVLMHRYSLTRAQALSRLERMAAEQSIETGEQARRIVEAVEQLALGS